MTKSLQARLGLACLMTVSAFCAVPASAQEGMTMKNILGSMGIVPQDKDAIQYRERAPLVLPKGNGTLRAPEAPMDYTAANPNWPTDPDVAAKRRREASALVPAGQSEIRRWSERDPKLSPAEMAMDPRGRRGGSIDRDANWGRNEDARDKLYLSPAELAAGKPDPNAALQDGQTEPARRTLSEPPSGFRRSAQGKRIEAVSADPRIDQQARDANPLNWIRDQFNKKDDDEF